MEIHPPEHPIRTRREFFTHLAMIVLGILIALLLENVVESWHHHSTADHTHRAILLEISANRKQLESFMNRSVELRNNVQAGLKTVDEYRKKGGGDLTVPRFDIDVAELTSGAWHTAETTGALGYLDAEQVEKLATIYEVQAEFMAEQRELRRVVARAKSGGPRSVDQFDSIIREVDAALNMTDFASAWLTSVYRGISNKEHP